MLFSRRKTSTSQITDSDLRNSSLQNKEKKLLSKLIDTELNNIKMKPNHNGRQYIFEAIMYMLENNPKTPKELSPISHIATSYNLYTSNVSRDMRTAINHAWLNTPIEVLEDNYKAPISSDLAEPTPMELIYYYYRKIKDLL